MAFVPAQVGGHNNLMDFEACHRGLKNLKLINKPVEILN